MKPEFFTHANSFYVLAFAIVYIGILLYAGKKFSIPNRYENIVSVLLPLYVMRIFIFHTIEVQGIMPFTPLNYWNIMAGGCGFFIGKYMDEHPEEFTKADFGIRYKLLSCQGTKDALKFIFAWGIVGFIVYKIDFFYRYLEWFMIVG